MDKKIRLSYKGLIAFTFLIGFGVIVFGANNFTNRKGQVVFQELGCVACHAVNEISDSDIGPPLDGLADRAADRVAGLSAREYIRQSIVDPHKYIVEGWSPTCNPPTFGPGMDENDLNNLVTWLLTLSSE